MANISKIWSVFQSIVGALQAALSGDLASKIAKAVENALAAAIVPVLDMFARLAGIADVPGTIRRALKTLKMKAQAPVRKVLNKVGEAIQKLWEKFLTLFGLKGANAVPEPDKWGQTSENKLWSEAGTSMITMSPGQRLDQALKDAVANGADPDRVRPCQLRMEQHQSITKSISEAVKQPQTQASARNIVHMKGLAKIVQGDLKTKLPECLSGCNCSGKPKEYPRGPLCPCQCEWVGMNMKRSPIVVDGRPYTFGWDKCRTTSAEGEVIAGAGAGDRKPNEQQKMLNVFFGENPAHAERKKHDAGHLIANQLGGPGDFTNLVPMEKKFNQNKAWKQMEEWIHSCLDEKNTCERKGRMSVTVHYGRLSKAPPCRDVPTSFDVEFTLLTKSGGVFGSEHISLKNDDNEAIKKKPGDPCPGAFF